MNSNLNKNQNIGDKKFFFNQTEKNDYNDKNINIKFINSLKMEKNLAFSSDFKNNDSQYIPKKRKRPEEEEKEEPPKILKENEIYEVLHKNYKLIEHEIEEKEKKKMKLEEDIQKMQKELVELNEEIDKYKSQNLEIFNILNNNENNYKGKDDIKIIKNNKYEENKVNLFPLNQDLNLNLNIPNILIPEFNEDTILQTIIVNDENQNPNDEQKVETSIVFKTLGKHKLLNEETTNKNILEGFDQYSIKCLTDNLNFKIKEGTKEDSIKIKIENDGKFCWPINETFLITDENKSTIKSQKISLLPLIPKEKCTVNIPFNLDKLKKGIYKNYLVLNAKNKNYGNIEINIEIF